MHQSEIQTQRNVMWSQREAVCAVVFTPVHFRAEEKSSLQFSRFLYTGVQFNPSPSVASLSLTEITYLRLFSCLSKCPHGHCGLCVRILPSCSGLLWHGCVCAGILYTWHFHLHPLKAPMSVCVCIYMYFWICFNFAFLFAQSSGITLLSFL